MDKCVCVEGSRIANCSTAADWWGVSGQWCGAWGAAQQSKRITAKHSSAGRLSHSLSTLLCCFPFYSFYSFLFFSPSSAIISLFLVVSLVVVVIIVFVTLEVQMLSSFAFVVLVVVAVSSPSPFLSLSVSLSFSGLGLSLSFSVPSSKLTSYVFPFQLSVCACVSVSVRSCVLLSFILLVIHTCV